MKRWLRFTLAAAYVAILGIYVLRELRVSTDISEFMPSPPGRSAQLSKALAKSSLSRTWILSIEGQSKQESLALSRALEAALRQDTELMSRLSFLQGGPEPGMEEALYGLLMPARIGLAAPTAEEAQELVTDEGLRAALLELRTKLSSPLSTLIAPVAPQDPFLVVPGILERLERGASAGLAVEDGRYLAQDRYAIVLLGAKASAFDAKAQRKVAAHIQQAWQAVAGNAPSARLEQSGLSRFSVAAEQAISSDIRRISIVSSVSLLVLCLVLFRSLLLSVLTFVPVAAGMLTAVAALLAWFGTVHGLTLAFGASLIGVCVDYVIHFYVHHLDAPSPAGPSQTLLSLWPGLALGAVTTVAGFIVLFGSNFPGLRQAALFGAVGVLTALFATRFLLPELMPKRSRPVRLRRRLSEQLLRFVAAWPRRPALVGGLFAIVLAVTALGLLRVRFEDDLSRLTSFDPGLLEEDERVRSRVAQLDSTRFVVATGATTEEALRVNERIAAQLEKLRQRGVISNFQSAAGLLPSQRTQQAVAEQLRSARLETRLPEIASSVGFAESAFQPFLRELPGPLQLLSYDSFLGTPAETLLRPFRVQLDEGVAMVSFLSGVQSPQAIEAAVAPIADAVFIDQGALMSSAQREYQRRTWQLLAIGLLVVWGLLWWRYRQSRLATAALLPAVVAAALSVAVLSLLGVPMNLMSLSSLLMVLSIGVDYGVFLTEASLASQADDSSLRATLTGLLVACLSTVLGFGVLSLSRQPAMETIGQIAAVGVTASLLLSPLSLLLARAPRSVALSSGDLSAKPPSRSSS